MKLHHGLVGFPDRLLIKNDGGCIFIEFKRPRTSPTRIQSHWLAWLHDRHHRTAVVRYLWQFVELL